MTSGEGQYIEGLELKRWHERRENIGRGGNDVRCQEGANRQHRVGDMGQETLCLGSRGGTMASGKRAGILLDLVF